MSVGVVAIFVKETDELVAVCENSTVAEVQLGLMGDGYYSRSFDFTRPLDPAPWRRFDERFATLDSMVAGVAWSPRSGFSNDSAAYAELGGIDPYPLFVRAPEGMVVKGRTRYAYGDKFASKSAVFAPRKGYIQDEEKYKRP